MSLAAQQTYEQLADRCERRQDARQRDVFLVLAADAAFADGRREDAERLRARILQVSPHSLLRPYNSFAEAMQSADIKDYLADLRVHYPPERAETMLNEGSNSAAPREPVIFSLKEPTAETLAGSSPPAGQPAASAARRRRAPSRSPYEAETQLASGEERPERSERSGALVIGLLIVALLGLGAASLWFAVIQPLVRW